MVRLQESKGQFLITIPQEFIRKKKWQKGKELILSFNERGNIELVEVDKE
jgi:hypothetical protein